VFKMTWLKCHLKSNLTIVCFSKIFFKTFKSSIFRFFLVENNILQGISHSSETHIKLEIESWSWYSAVSFDIKLITILEIWILQQNNIMKFRWVDLNSFCVKHPIQTLSAERSWKSVWLRVFNTPTQFTHFISSHLQDIWITRLFHTKLLHCIQRWNRSLTKRYNVSFLKSNTLFFYFISITKNYL